MPPKFTLFGGIIGGMGRKAERSCPQMSLKALEVKAFIASAKPYKKADELGLYLEVFPNGSKLWRFKYRFSGKEKRLALGAYPDVSLAEARELRDAARKKLRNGTDPALERKLGKIAAKVSAGNSFQLVAEEFITVKQVQSGRANATIAKTRWLLTHLTPALGSRPIAEIEPAELLAVLKRVEAKGKRETARRLRSFASMVFRYGVATTRCKTDPAALLSNALAAPQVKHRAAITDPVQVGQLLRTTDTYTGSPVVRLALQIGPHVFLRPGELRFGLWSEVDWEAKVWHLPAGRTKMRRAHSVPLSEQVVALLKQLQEHSGDYELMFPGQRSHKRPVSENTFNAAYRRMDYDKDTLTSHGLRTTASTLLNESGKFHPDAIERALSHKDKDKIRGIYARGEFWQERVAMAQWWSDYLDKLRAGGGSRSLRRG